MQISFESLETPALTKAQLADLLFDQIGLNKRESKDMVDAFFDLVVENLISGEDSQATSDLIMLEADARRLLKIMLGDDPVKGIVLAQNLAGAMASLEAAVAQDETARRLRSEQAQAGVAPADDSQEIQLDPVRLAQRARPMINMLERCQAQDVDMVWGV
eukprot:gene1107-1082_t